MPARTPKSEKDPRDAEAQLSHDSSIINTEKTYTRGRDDQIAEQPEQPERPE